MRPAECLQGLTLDGGWKVMEQVTPSANATGGKFSVGYVVRNERGVSAYLKALDFSIAMQSPDPARALQDLTEAYNFERNLLSSCKDRKLDRIVTPIADGKTTAPGSFGVLSTVCYLIFEMASCDIRQQLGQIDQFDLAWALRSMHHSAVGLKQLHSASIAHQDLKPSNVLFFHEKGSKLADLGRASEKDGNSPFDSFTVPGDTGHAAPELFYGMAIARDFQARCAADLYLLGSLFFFWFAGCSARSALRTKLANGSMHKLTQKDFASDLPYLQQAFCESLTDLELEVRPLAGDLTEGIMGLVKQLCEPDPKLRMDSEVRSTIFPRYDLERTVSKLNLLATKAELGIL